MSGLFNNDIVKNTLSAIEAFVDDKIINIFGLNPFKDLIFETNATACYGNGIQIGLQENIGLVIIEIWRDFKESLHACLFEDDFDLIRLYDSFFNSVVNGVKHAIHKYRDAFELYANATLVKLLNYVDMFFDAHEIKHEKSHTACLKQGFVVAIKTLMDLNTPLDVRIKVALERVLVGAVEMIRSISKGYIDSILAGNPVICPLINQICDMLFDKFNEFIVNGELFKFFESIMSFINRDVEYFRRQAELVEEYAAKLMEIDLDKFRREINAYAELTDFLIDGKSDAELNKNMKCIVKRLGLHMPWGDDFDAFMCDKSKVMRFE